MNRLVRTVLEELITTGQSEKLQLNIYDLPIVKGDLELLKRVFENLLSNAIKYSGKKDRPVIEVGAEVNAREHIFYVKDNGVGFDKAYKDKLFGIFQRLHRPEEFEGTGIGLAIVQRVIMRSGGRVWAESELNNGATFYFSLPV